MGVSLCILEDVEEGIDYFYKDLEATPNEPTILTNLSNAMSLISKQD